MQTPPLNAHDIQALLESPAWHERKFLFALLGADAASAAALGYSLGPDPLHPEFAFLAVAVGERRRSFVVLKPDAASLTLVTFDIVPSPRAIYHLEGFAEPVLRGNVVTAALPSRRAVKASILLPGDDGKIEAATGRIAISQTSASPESLFLCAMQFGQTSAERVEFVGSVDLAGVRAGEWVILFHNEVRSAREPQFFFVEREGPVKCLVGGLAPGAWELWHNGFVKDPSLEVSPRAGALYFEGLAGNYFFRRYS